MTPTSHSSSGLAIASDVLETLRCPKSGGPLTLGEHEGQPVLVSEAAGVCYPIQDSLPVLIEHRAIPFQR